MPRANRTSEAGPVAWETEPDLTDLETHYIELPTGRVLSIDSHWQEGLVARHHVYTVNRRWFQLGCATWSTVPDDRWLSVAETFELLPKVR